ncbi:trypsin domain-containing protein [Phthorimaea operculella]|nr:trypsin domain-containing protein [Phthorimaea operculella]
MSAEAHYVEDSSPLNQSSVCALRFTEAQRVPRRHPMSATRYLSRPSSVLGVPGASCPGTVAIMNLKYGRLHCGGSLVTDKHVLTAGVCFVWYNFTMMEVLLGLDSFDDLTKIVTKRTFVDVTIHDKYHFGAVRDKNDLAIGILNKPVVFSATIVPVCLPEKDRKLKDQGTIVGWGRMGMLTSHARTLMKASVTIMSEEDCLNSKPKKYIDDETMFCAFSEKGGCQV